MLRRNIVDRESVDMMFAYHTRRRGESVAFVSTFSWAKCVCIRVWALSPSFRPSPGQSTEDRVNNPGGLACYSGLSMLAQSHSSMIVMNFGPFFGHKAIGRNGHCGAEKSGLNCQ